MSEKTLNPTDGASNHYNSDYFDWQKNIGEFGGWANSYKFRSSIKPSDVVIDFGCGGGFLLKNINCKRRIGIEPNPNAVQSIVGFGIEHYRSPLDALNGLSEGVADVIISNHALEHTLNPLQELISLKRLLRVGGVINFVVPCESIKCEYNPNNIDRHLFTWSPLNLGNLFAEAGYSVEYSRSYIHRWPPFYTRIARLGWPIFNLVCRLYARLQGKVFQVELRAKRID